ncbi:MarR family winged helix-turn-helix transcriptional regulator [Brevibacillus sp. NRS-1366]|uniref:MarR family winged helix-turn-helix transcriptional regulator n=1 Tax=Brevibacillus sp. NRS-1366 TaxID=3233899 RepID=UPI003D204096
MKEENAKGAYFTYNRKDAYGQGEVPSSDYLLSHCLYFTVARFARQMDKLAEEAFASLDIPPSYAYLIITIKDHPGISQKELCKKLSIAPSTSTRFIDKLVKSNYIERKPEGKHMLMYLTEAGKVLCQQIYDSLENIYLRHSEILEQSHSQQLIHLLHEAS